MASDVFKGRHCCSLTDVLDYILLRNSMRELALIPSAPASEDFAGEALHKLNESNNQHKLQRLAAYPGWYQFSKYYIVTTSTCWLPSWAAASPATKSIIKQGVLVQRLAWEVRCNYIPVLT